jgi:hypothetical protein
MGGEYNASYGFTVAASTFERTFVPEIAERLNKYSDDYRITGIWSEERLC